MARALFLKLRELPSPSLAGGSDAAAAGEGPLRALEPDSPGGRVKAASAVFQCESQHRTKFSFAQSPTSKSIVAISAACSGSRQGVAKTFGPLGMTETLSELRYGNVESVQ